MTQLDPSEIEEAFELIDDWEERYRYVIELGRELHELRVAGVERHTRGERPPVGAGR